MQDSAIATKYTLSQKEQAIYNQFLKRQPSQQSQSSQQSQQSQQPSQKEQKAQMVLPVSQQQTDVFAQEIQQMIKTEQMNKNMTNQQSKLIEQQMQMMKDNQVALFQMMKQIMEGNKDWEQLKNNQQKQVVDSLQPIMTQLQEFKNGYQQSIELSSQVKSQVENLSKQVNSKEQKFQLQQEVISQLANLSNNKTNMNSLVQEICSTLQAISFNALNNQQTSSETSYNTTQGISFLQNQIKQVQRETEQIEKDLFSRYKKIQEELIQLKKQNQEELQGILGVNFKQKLDNFDYADLINDLDLIRKERNKIVQTYNSTYVQYPSYFKKQKPATSDSKTKGKKQQVGKKKEDEQKVLQEMMYYKDKQKYRPQQQASYVENRYIIEAPPPPKKVKVYTNVQKLSEDQMQDSELQPRVPVQPSQLASLPENLTQQQFNELKNMISLGNQKIYVRDQETQIQQDTELYDQNKMLFEEQKKNGPSAVYIQQQESQNQKKEENKFPQVSQLKPKVQYKHPDIKNIVPKMIQIEDINQFPFDIQQAALEADQQVQQKLGQDKEQEMSKKAVDLALDLILQKLNFKEIPQQQKPQQTTGLGKWIGPKQWNLCLQEGIPVDENLVEVFGQEVIAEMITKLLEQKKMQKEQTSKHIFEQQENEYQEEDFESYESQDEKQQKKAQKPSDLVQYESTPSVEKINQDMQTEDFNFGTTAQFGNNQIPQNNPLQQQLLFGQIQGVAFQNLPGNVTIIPQIFPYQQTPVFQNQFVPQFPVQPNQEAFQPKQEIVQPKQQVSQSPVKEEQKQEKSEQEQQVEMENLSIQVSENFLEGTFLKLQQRKQEPDLQNNIFTGNIFTVDIFNPIAHLKISQEQFSEQTNSLEEVNSVLSEIFSNSIMTSDQDDEMKLLRSEGEISNILSSGEIGPGQLLKDKLAPFDWSKVRQSEQSEGEVILF